MDILLLLVGLGLILGGANFLTDGSAAVAQRFRVPEFIIGLTIVAVGTSMPELVVSVLSAAAGNSDVAIGNVVGSNIFNVFVILGICALIRPLVLTKETSGATSRSAWPRRSCCRRSLPTAWYAPGQRTGSAARTASSCSRSTSG